MAETTCITIYQPLATVKDALLGILQNEYSGIVTNIDGAGGQVEVDHAIAYEPHDGEPARIALFGSAGDTNQRWLVTFELTGDSATRVVAATPQEEPVLQALAGGILEKLQPNRIEAPPKAKGRRRADKPNLRTQERFEVFRRLKSQHPTWSQSKVAMEASPELKESVTPETVRNTYRLVGEKWQRGDRIR